MKSLQTVLLSAWPDHGVWYGIIRGVRSYTREHRPWHLRYVSPLALPDAIRHWGRVDGIIGHVIEPKKLPAALRTAPRVVSTVNDGVGRFPLVCQDDYAIGRLAAEEFLRRGFRHFASCVVAPFQYALRRHQGFFDTVRRAGLPCAVHIQQRSLPAYLHKPWAAFRPSLLPWLRSLAKPVAVFTGSDHLAVEFIDACELAGVAVPEEAAIIGVDNDEVCCNVVHPPLSSVYTPGETIGHRASQLLHRMLRGQAPPSQPILIAPLRVVIRRSSDLVAVDDPAVAAVLRYLRRREHGTVSVKELESVVSGVSVRTLHRRFIETLGYGPGEAVLRSRIERAKSLLSSSDLSVEEVAHACGWSNGRTLSTLFHQRTGMTPRQFRARQMDPV